MSVMVLLRLFKSYPALYLSGKMRSLHVSAGTSGAGGAHPKPPLPPTGAGGRKGPREGGGSPGAPRAMRSLTDVVIHPQRPPEADAGRDGFVHQLLDALQEAPARRG